MNFAALFRAFDAAVALRDASRRLMGAPPPPESGLSTTPSGPASAIVGQIETRLTNVVVAALKEAFDRDHARMELERAQLEDQRRRAEEAMRLEVRRQAMDRELGRLRLIAAAALIGWITSFVLVAVRLSAMTPVARGLTAAGWLLLLGSLGAAFMAQGRVTLTDSSVPVDASTGGAAALWLLIAGLAVSAIALLF